MKETKQTVSATPDPGSKNGKPSTQGEDLPGPKGIGMAVALDWGLVVQILLTPVMPLIFGGMGPMKVLNGGLLGSPGVQILLVLPFAALVGVFGESVRRGWRWAQPVQIVANALLFLSGIANIISTWEEVKAGNYWGVYTAFLLLVISPLIVWRMAQPATSTWFRRVTSAEARKRHGGMWVVWIAVWAIVGGVLQTLAAFYH